MLRRCPCGERSRGANVIICEALFSLRTGPLLNESIKVIVGCCMYSTRRLGPSLRRLEKSFQNSASAVGYAPVQAYSHRAQAGGQRRGEECKIVQNFRKQTLDIPDHFTLDQADLSDQHRCCSTTHSGRSSSSSSSKRRLLGPRNSLPSPPPRNASA